MPDLGNRPTRFNLSVPVSFQYDGELIQGETVNVSQSGLMATFQRYLEVWITGELSLFVNDYQLSIPAKVARAQGREAGITFLPVTENDRRAIQIMVDYASALMTPGERVRSDF